MATLTSSTRAIEPPREKRGTFSKSFNWTYFLQDNITGSRGLTIWVALLTVITLAVTVSQLGSAPRRAGIIVAVWAIAVVATILGELFTLHNPITRWLKENMFNSVSNTLITLLLALVVGQVMTQLWNWGYVNATFDPALTAPDVRSSGASWGVIWGARKLLLTGPLEPEYTWRVILTLVLLLALWAFTYIATRRAIKASVPVFSKIMNGLWLLAPIASYIFLAGLQKELPAATKTIDFGLFWIRFNPVVAIAGLTINMFTLVAGLLIVLATMAVLWFFRVIQLNPTAIVMWVLAWPVAYVLWRVIAQTGWFPSIDVDHWGGLLLTMIFAFFVNIISFPIGILLALGRRADVYGIPSWIVWPVAILSTGYLLMTSTPELWETSRNGIEKTLALWPVLIIISAYFFMRSFNGNVVKAFSILSIEIIRGVPLITLLFMAIIMAPFFTSEGVELDKFWAVIVGFSIFSSAYMAELVRGGLQAIPKGQYEASDSLGLNTLQKYRFIILPQALRILIPPLAGAVIGTFKSSSLVALVGLLDLVGVVRGIIANPDWLGLRSELYAFMFVLYFVVSSVVSAYSRRLEERVGLGSR
ncbi:MAG: amino acid ABC transporter permease [Caldilineaceae bacterium]|nr:amino acid ABC transporter permease [Caldilineaceae bacterium]